jgi:hypothetical protein
VRRVAAVSFFAVVLLLVPAVPSYGRPFILVGPVVVLPAALLLSSAAGRRTAGARHRGRATAAVVLVLLSQRQGLLSDCSHVPGSVDQGPAETPNKLNSRLEEVSEE